MKRLERGIFREGKRFRVLVRVVPFAMRSKRYPPKTTLETMRAWRDATRTALLQKRKGTTAEAGTLAADVERYLKAVAAMPTASERRHDLDAWLVTFGHLRRDAITAEQVRAQLHAWRTVGPRLVRIPGLPGQRGTFKEVEGPLAASTVNHRRTALAHLYTVLDGKGAPNPMKEVPKFREPDVAPRGVPYEVIDAVLGRMRDSRVKTVLRVLAYVGIRPIQIKRLTAADWNREAGTLFVRPAKGARGGKTLPLTAAGTAALTAFDSWDLWGKSVTETPMRVAWRNAVRKTDPALRIRPYDLRHSFLTALFKLTGNIRAVQDFATHADSRMTERYTLGAVPTVLDAARAAFDADAVARESRRQTTQAKKTAAASDGRKLPGKVSHDCNVVQFGALAL